MFGSPGVPFSRGAHLGRPRHGHPHGLQGHGSGPAMSLDAFTDPWSYGLGFLKPDPSGPPTVAELHSRGRSGSEGSGGADGSTHSSAGTAEPADPEAVALTKDRRKTLKKLRQITNLLQKRQAGDVLDEQQEAKVATRDVLLRQLEDVEARLHRRGIPMTPATPGLSPASLEILTGRRASGEAHGSGLTASVVPALRI